MIITKYCQYHRYAIEKNDLNSVFEDFLDKKNNESSAEELINSFNRRIKSGEDIHYVALTHKAESGQFSITLPPGRPSKTTDEYSMNIQEIRSSMKINDSQDVLLAFAWVTGEELELVRKFPELFMIDVTEKTNKEKRGLVIGTGIDGLGRIFSGIHCFIPNAKEDTFFWIYDVALRELWGEEIISKVQVIITDGESCLFSPVDELKISSSQWQGITRYRLVISFNCDYHEPTLIIN